MRPTFVKDRGPDETLHDWAARFYSGVQPVGALTRKEDGAIWITLAHVPPRPIFTAEELAAQVHNIYDVKTCGKEADTYLPCFLQFDEARALFHSEARFCLPLLKSVFLDPVVLVDPDGTRRVIKPGFDIATGLYFWLAAGKKPIQPLTTTQHLLECFRGVPVETPGFRSNIMAFLLGFVTYDPKLETPVLVVTANTQGAGKTKTIEACGYILIGHPPAPVSPNGEEFSKQLGTRFIEGDRFINVDNVVAGDGKPYKNAALAQLVSQTTSKRIRLLGHNRSVEAQGVVFALSMNNCRLDNDLATRSLPVRLYVEKSHPMQPYVLGYAMDHRDEIYGELLGLALRAAPPMPEDVAPACRFRSWVRATYSRVTEFFGPPLLESTEEFSEGEQDFYAWGLDQLTAAQSRGETFEFKAHDLQTQIEASDNKWRGMYERFFSQRSARARSIAIGLFLKAQVGIRFGLGQGGLFVTLRCVRPSEAGKPAVYTFEKEEPENARSLAI